MKKVLLVILLLAAAGAGVAIYMWNKPHQTVADKKAVKVTADALADSFVKDEQAAHKTYLNQVLEVSGTVSEVAKNQDGKQVISLVVADPLSGVQCTMTADAVKAMPGDKVTIKGFYNAYILGVVLSDCVLVP